MLRSQTASKVKKRRAQGDSWVSTSTVKHYYSMKNISFFKSYLLFRDQDVCSSVGKSVRSPAPHKLVLRW